MHGNVHSFLCSTWWMAKLFGMYINSTAHSQIIQSLLSFSEEVRYVKNYTQTFKYGSN
jgi:hypothetical protein